MNHSQLLPDIRMLTQHFNEPGGDIEPWMFVPESNITEVSTTEHPGTATIWQAGRGGVAVTCAVAGNRAL